MTPPSSPIADAIDALAHQVSQLLTTPGQQSPGQTDALADRLFLLAQKARPVEFQTAIRLGHRADALRGRAIVKPFRPHDGEELAQLAGALRFWAAAVREAEGMAASRHQHPSPEASDPDVLDFRAIAARRRVQPPAAARTDGGDAA